MLSCACAVLAREFPFDSDGAPREGGHHCMERERFRPRLHHQVRLCHCLPLLARSQACSSAALPGSPQSRMLSTCAQRCIDRHVSSRRQDVPSNRKWFGLCCVCVVRAGTSYGERTAERKKEVEKERKEERSGWLCRGWCGGRHRSRGRSTDLGGQCRRRQGLVSLFLPLSICRGNLDTMFLA